MTLLTSGRRYLLDDYVLPDYVDIYKNSYVQDFTLYGKPARVFPFTPNWATPVTEILEWKTQVIRSRDGTEQRRQLRMIPRRGFEYSILLDRENASMLEAFLWGWQHKYFAVPVWTDGIKTTQDAFGAESELPLRAASFGFAAGHHALVYANRKDFELINIGAVEQERLVLSKPLDSDWPAGTKVYPVVLGRLGVTVATSRYTDAVVSANISFQTSADNTDPYLPPGAPITLYDGYEVITSKTNWSEQIDNEFSRQFDIVDSGTGPIGYFETEKVSRVTRPFKWFLKNRTDILEFRKLIGRLSGQVKTVWVPSWHEDFQVAASNSTDQSTLIVRGVWFKSFVDVDSSRDRLMITLPNGDTVFRRITNISPDFTNDTSVLRLDSTLGTTIGTSDNVRLRLLLRCRLATDKIVIPWQTDSIATPQTIFTTVKL